MSHTYHPNFLEPCRLCDTHPTVVVENHPSPFTGLCGPHFFHDLSMVDWTKWNDVEEDDYPDEDENED